MTDQPPLTGKEAYEARRQEQREVRIRQGLPRPQDTARQLPATVLWTIAVLGWLVAFGEALAVGLGLSWDWTPKLTIEAEASHLAANPLGTEFKITNSGRVPLHDVHFTCYINKQPNGKYLIRLSDSKPGAEPLDTLASGDDATRNCGTKLFSFGQNVPILTIDYEISYKWAFDSNPAPFQKHFVVKRGDGGSFFAVPDVQDQH